MKSRREFIQDLARIGATGIVVAAVPSILSPGTLLVTPPRSGALTVDMLDQAISDLRAYGGDQGPLTMWVHPGLFEKLCGLYEVEIFQPPADGFSPHLLMAENLAVAPTPDLPPTIEWVLTPGPSGRYHASPPVWPMIYGPR